MKDKIKQFYKKHKSKCDNVLIILFLIISYSIYLGFNSNKTEENKNIEKVSLVSLISDIENKNYKESLKVLYIKSSNTTEEKFFEISYHKENSDKEFKIELPQNTFTHLEKKLIDSKTPYEINEKDFFGKKTNFGNNYMSGQLISFFREILKSLIVMGAILFMFLKFETLFSKNKFRIIKPEDIKGEYNDLIGVEHIKKEINIIKPVLEKVLENEMRLDIKTNILFSGPPGTGKTKMASLLAKELNIPIVIASAADLETGYVNGGVKTMNSIYSAATKEKKCIIFLDEAQDLFRPRKGARKYDDDTQNALLAIIDGIKTTKTDGHIIWILASNFDDSLIEVDSAMMRRFPFKLNFKLPDKKQRSDLFKHYLSQLPKDSYEENIDYDYLADITSRISPAIIENIVAKSYLNFMENNIKVNTKVVIQNYEKEILGTTTSHQEDMFEQKKIIAIHELGHLIVDLYFSFKKHKTLEDVKKNNKVLKISLENVSKIGALGYVLNKENDFQLYNRKLIEQEICKLYGGHAAEEVYFEKENLTIGAYNDIQKATKLLKQVITEIPLYEDYKINFNELGEFKEINEEAINKIKTKSSELYLTSLDIIKNTQPVIDALYNVLIVKNTLTSEEIFTFLEENNHLLELLHNEQI